LPGNKKTENANLEELQKENQRLKKTVEDLSTINQLAQIISSTMPVNQILGKVVDVSVKAIKAEQGTISLLDEKQTDDPFKTLIRKVDVSGPQGQYRLDDHLSGWMLKNRKPLMINDLSQDPNFRGYQPVNQDIRSILSVPLMCKGKLIGVVNLFNKKEGVEFTPDDQRLFSIIASQSAQVIENARLYEKEKELQRVEHELQLARDIQEGLIPKTLPETKELDIASYFNPAAQVGGDYFDYFNLGEEQVGIVMADVSGHGASAALVMTMVKGIIHAIAHEFKSPDSLLKELNAIINQIGPREKFVTMTFLLFDMKASRLCFSNAGHNPLLFYNQQLRKCEMLPLRGPALGLSKLSVYQQKEVPLQSGDLILIYTDGVTEAFNEKGEMFEETRLLQAAEAAAAMSAAKIIDQVKNALLKFTNKAPQSDDMAMIAVKVS
jgi:sigma-B regulation protein RsbU (phosphoserine phosphatase)